MFFVQRLESWHFLLKQPQLIQQLNTFNNQLNNQEGLSSKEQQEICELFAFLGIKIDSKNFDASYTQALKKIQTEEKLPVSGKLDQETLEKVNALIFSKYLQEDLSYQKAVTQLKEELKIDTN